MRNTARHKSSMRTARQMETEFEDRQELRREEERDQAEDLNQSIQTGTHDSERLSVRWQPSYKTLKRRKSAPKPASKRRK